VAKYKKGNSRIFIELWDMSSSKDRTLETCRGLQLLSIPKWKWKDISIDFMTGLPRERKVMMPYMWWWIN